MAARRRTVVLAIGVTLSAVVAWLPRAQGGPAAAVPVAVVAHVASAPSPVRRSTPPRPARVIVAPSPTRAVPALSFADQLNAMVARFPRLSSARWYVTPGIDHYAQTDLRTGNVYVSPTVPSYRLFDVVAHEWSHVRSMQDYGYFVTGAVNGMNAAFGGSDLVGPERAADCMAKLLGAVWTHYTPCDDASWRAKAQVLLSGQPL